MKSSSDKAEKYFFELVKKNEVNNYQTITNAAKETVKIYTNYNWEYFFGFFY